IDCCCATPKPLSVLEIARCLSLDFNVCSRRRQRDQAGAREGQVDRSPIRMRRQARRAAFVSNAQCSLGNDILQQVWFVLSDFRKDLLQRCKSRLEHGDLEVCNSIGDQLRFENFIVEWTAVPRDDRPWRSDQRHQSSDRSLRYGWRGPVFGSRCWSREGDRLLHLHPPNLSIRVTQET